ncbi:DGQHR domain-containing protein [Sphingomonas sp.]|uniref:DGQHR domain-containing protein n=1 Tax=Sphingomonas sp. TaxID=28214 RepID=UPI002DD69C8A|nr:DGQHR domain-containing protein [Sphingomonas sp.]
MNKMTTLPCMRGKSLERPVLLGFASARVLHGASFADVLDEASGRGYQRRLNSRHSLDFRRYAQRPESTTIPLTFNLRGSDGDGWSLQGGGEGVILNLARGAKPLAQVDCQHRLGHLSDLDVELPFMTFVGLTEREEMEIFGVINGKAKGLSNSLLDFHDAQLCADLASEKPELLVALHLKNEPTSPWYNRLDLGGNQVSGLERRASLRTMQKACRILTRRLKPRSLDDVARIAHDFWLAVAMVMPDAFAKPRGSLVTKGVGVYALTELAADFVLEAAATARCDTAHFAALVGDIAPLLDWSSDGPLGGLGGEGGARRAADILRELRRRPRLAVANG